MPSTMPVGGVFRNSFQIRWAIRSSEPPSLRATLSDRTMETNRPAAATSTMRPIRAKRSARDSVG
jgi:hypothetical protein